MKGGAQMTYHKRLTFFIFVDSFIVLTAVFFSCFLVNATFHVLTQPILYTSLTLLITHLLFSFRFNLYKKAWEYASVGELIIISKTVSLSIFAAVVVQVILLHDIYFRLLVDTWMLQLFFIGSSRFVWRIYRDSFMTKSDHRNRTLIIGAGSAGTMVARQLLNNRNGSLIPVGFIDDNIYKQKLDILGIPVVGTVKNIKEVVQNHRIDHIVIAIPSLNQRELTPIYKECCITGAKTQTIPMLEDLVLGKVSVNQFRDVEVEDLLGREPVELDMTAIKEYVTDKVVLVTGAGGSIGSEICRQLAGFYPKQLLLLGHGENSIYSIEMELKEVYGMTTIDFIPIIADLQDQKKIETVMKTYTPHVIYHAAAHKHVPLMERNPEEAVKNNVIGTMNVARAATSHGVKTFVMISSDKAVNPTSVMGATKRLAEMVIQHMDQMSATTFVAVRFGNVLGSRGSVIPLFKKQIQKGGPVTVTHPDMVRFFMTIPEASRLVLQAGALAKGGEIFVLDMGEPIKIIDLARNLIKLSGHAIEDIGIEYSGIRPGEKLFEELLNEEEVHETRVYPKIYIGKAGSVYIQEIEELILSYADLGKEQLRGRLLDLVNQKDKTPTLMSVSI